jgi:hypothetical protein
VEGLQPPPENPEGVPPVAGPESIGHAQLKIEIFFFTSLEPHSGHTVSSSVAPTFWRREKLSLHALQLYSYIGIKKKPLISIFYKFINIFCMMTGIYVKSVTCYSETVLFPYCLENCLNEFIFRYRTSQAVILVDDDLWHSLNIIFDGKMGEL